MTPHQREERALHLVELRDGEVVVDAGVYDEGGAVDDGGEGELAEGLVELQVEVAVVLAHALLRGCEVVVVVVKVVVVVEMNVSMMAMVVFVFVVSYN